MAAVRALVPKEVKTVFYVDGHKSYEDLEAFGELRAVDHQKGYSIDGASSNLAESYFSRARRGEVGSYHHWSPTYLDLYAEEMCWRENHLRHGTRSQSSYIVSSLGDGVDGGRSYFAP